jgi:Spy/CpxP family protein refolding chaperone
MKRIAKVSMAATAVVAGLVLLTGFRGGCGGHGHDPARIERAVAAHLEDALDDLKATGPQRAEVVALKDRLLKDGQALAAGQREAKRELLAQWDAEKPDAGKVHALVDARVDALRAFAHEAADAALQLHGILTPEQRAQVSRKIHRRVDDR